MVAFSLSTFSPVLPPAVTCHFSSSPTTARKPRSRVISIEIRCCASLSPCLPPSSNHKVVVPRERGKNAKLIDAMANCGITCLELPLIQHAKSPNVDKLSSLLRSTSFDWIIIRSPEAGLVFLDAWKYTKTLISLFGKSNSSSRFSKFSLFSHEQKRVRLQMCYCSLDSQTPQDPPSIFSSNEENELLAGGSNGGGNNEDERDWTTSFLLFAFWAGLMYYVFVIAPNQTPVTDSYFLQKLLNLKGDDGFEMNQVMVALWYIMGLWPLVYSMLLLPTGRSSKSKIPIWPFVSLSFIGGAYALIPYFVLWKPPAPPLEESELNRWPLNILESKLTAGITMAAGLAVIIYAFSSAGDVWKEFYQYFKGSKFIHIMSIDFCLFSTFAPFWVYNDMTARKWGGKGFWLLPLSLIPFIGPALYLLLRPSLSVGLLTSTPESDKT